MSNTTVLYDAECDTGTAANAAILYHVECEKVSEREREGQEGGILVGCSIRPFCLMLNMTQRLRQTLPCYISFRMRQSEVRTAILQRGK